MNTYEKAVSENMVHMGSKLSEWTAIPITGFAETTNEKSEAVKMPQFAFPADYTSAPSLYKNTNAACGVCCELCGHDIKNVYWLQNDTKKWTLGVGSECVTQFAEGKSGEQLADELRRQLNRELVVALVNLVKTIQHCFGYRAFIGYGRTQEAWSSNEARAHHKTIIKLLGKIDTDSTDGAISGFITRKGNEARSILQDLNVWQAMPPVIASAIRNLQAKAGGYKTVLAYKRINGQNAAEWQLADAQKQLDQLNAEIAKIQAAGKLV